MLVSRWWPWRQWRSSAGRSTSSRQSPLPAREKKRGGGGDVGKKKLQLNCASNKPPQKSRMQMQHNASLTTIHGRGRRRKRRILLIVPLHGQDPIRSTGAQRDRERGWERERERERRGGPRQRCTTLKLRLRCSAAVPRASLQSG